MFVYISGDHINMVSSPEGLLCLSALSVAHCSFEEFFNLFSVISVGFVSGAYRVAESGLLLRTTAADNAQPARCLGPVELLLRVLNRPQGSLTGSRHVDKTFTLFCSNVFPSDRLRVECTRIYYYYASRHMGSTT